MAAMCGAEHFCIPCPVGTFFLTSEDLVPLSIIRSVMFDFGDNVHER